MKSFDSRGDVFEVTATAAVASGSIQAIGNLKGIAQAAAANGEKYALVVEGVVRVPKASGDSFAVGDSIDLDESANEAAAAGTDAVVLDAAGAGTTEVRCKLTPHA